MTQVFFVELLSEPTASLLRVLTPLTLPENVELRDGLQLFSGRHLRQLVATKHPALGKALKALDRALSGEGV